MIREALAVTSGTLVFAGYVPYALGIIRGKVRPARSTRTMFAALLIVTLLQQKALGSGVAMAVTIGEAVGSLGILALSVRRGHGGWQGLDKLCYALLALDILVWQTSRNAFIALWLSMLADAIAYTPTLYKTWHDPHSETPLFYVLGALSPLLSIAAASMHTVQVVLFPIYLVVANAVELALIYRPTRIAGTASDDALL